MTLDFILSANDTPDMANNPLEEDELRREDDAAREPSEAQVQDRERNE